MVRASLSEAETQHVTWAHGVILQRPVTPVTRRELLDKGRTLHGPSPTELLPPLAPGQLQDFIRRDLKEYWLPATGKPLRWFYDVWVDLGRPGRGRAVEPVIREALWRLTDDHLPDGTEAVGGFWTRTDDPEIDIVGADRAPLAKRITVVGSVKWLENTPFDSRDLSRLVVHRSQLPVADEETPLPAVSRSGCTADVPHFTPADLLAAWAGHVKCEAGSWGRTGRPHALRQSDRVGWAGVPVERNVCP